MKPTYYLKQRKVNRLAARLSVWSSVPALRHTLRGLLAWRAFLRPVVGSNPSMLPAMHRANQRICAHVMALELSIGRQRWTS